MYGELREELERRLPTMDDINHLARHNVVIRRAQKIARAEGLTQEQMLVLAVAWLAIHNEGLIQDALHKARIAPPVDPRAEYAGYGHK